MTETVHSQKKNVMTCLILKIEKNINEKTNF